MNPGTGRSLDVVFFGSYDVSRHPRVVAVLAGHAHTAASATFAGLPLRVAPGVISTAVLPPEARDEIGLDYDQPPALSLHVFDGTSLITHTRACT